MHVTVGGSTISDVINEILKVVGVTLNWDFSSLTCSSTKILCSFS